MSICTVSPEVVVEDLADAAMAALESCGLYPNSKKAVRDTFFKAFDDVITEESRKYEDVTDFPSPELESAVGRRATRISKLITALAIYINECGEDFDVNESFEEFVTSMEDGEDPIEVTTPEVAQWARWLTT